MALTTLRTARNACYDAMDELPASLQLHDGTYRSLGTAPKYRRICLGMTGPLALSQEHEYKLFGPLWHHLRKKNVEGPMLGWTLLYSLPETTYIIKSRTLRWLEDRSFYSLINMAVAVSKGCVIATLGPGKTFHDLSTAFDLFNANLPSNPLEENDDRMTGIESNAAFRLHPQRQRGGLQITPCHIQDRVFSKDVPVRISPHILCLKIDAVMIRDQEYRELVEHFANGVALWMKRQGFYWPEASQILTHFRTLVTGRLDPYVLLQFPYEQAARTAYYVFNDYMLCTQNGHTEHHCDLFNPMFKAELSADDGRLQAQVELLDTTSITPVSIAHLTPADVSHGVLALSLPPASRTPEQARLAEDEVEKALGAWAGYCGPSQNALTDAQLRADHAAQRFANEEARQKTGAAQSSGSLNPQA